MVGGKDCEGVTNTPKDGEDFKLGEITVKALYTPCHTQDSICWFMEDSTGRVVFTGDTLFHGGLSPDTLPNLLLSVLASRMWQVFRGNSRGDAHCFEQNIGFHSR